MVEKKKKNQSTKVAETISFISTPAIVGTFFLVYALYNFSPDINSFFKSFLLVFTFSVGIPLFATFYLLKKQKIGNFHIKNRKERVVPFAIAMILSTLSLLIMKYLNENPELLRMMIILYLMALGYVAITFLKFKISGHVFILTSALIVLTAFLDLRFIYFVPLIAVVGWARVHLKEHSIGEIVGAFAYTIISFLAFSLLINN